jgi:hypothetical protein
MPSDGTIGDLVGKLIVLRVGFIRQAIAREIKRRKSKSVGKSKKA